VHQKQLSVIGDSASNYVQAQQTAGPTAVVTAHESNALCYLIGWIAFKLKTQLKSCTACINFLVSNDPNEQKHAKYAADCH
jgi:hypothetical protein